MFTHKDRVWLIVWNEDHIHTLACDGRDLDNRKDYTYNSSRESVNIHPSTYKALSTAWYYNPNKKWWQFWKRSILNIEPFEVRL